MLLDKREDVLVAGGGFEPETCGLRDRCPCVQGVLYSPLSCGYVRTPSMEIAVSRPSIAEIVGQTMGDR